MVFAAEILSGICTKINSSPSAITRFWLSQVHIQDNCLPLGPIHEGQEKGGREAEREQMALQW